MGMVFLRDFLRVYVRPGGLKFLILRAKKFGDIFVIKAVFSNIFASKLSKLNRLFLSLTHQKNKQTASFQTLFSVRTFTQKVRTKVRTENKPDATLQNANKINAVHIGLMVFGSR